MWDYYNIYGNFAGKTGKRGKQLNSMDFGVLKWDWEFVSVFFMLSFRIKWRASPGWRSESSGIAGELFLSRPGAPSQPPPAHLQMQRWPLGRIYKWCTRRNLRPGQSQILTVIVRGDYVSDFQLFFLLFAIIVNLFILSKKLHKIANESESNVIEFCRQPHVVYLSPWSDWQRAKARITRYGWDNTLWLL